MIDPADIAAQIEVVIKEVDKGRGAAKIAEKCGMNPLPAEQMALFLCSEKAGFISNRMQAMNMLNSG